MGTGVSDLAALMAEAWARRSVLHADPATTAYRCFHGHGDGAPGVTLDRLGDAWVLTGPSAVVDAGARLIDGLPESPAWLVGRPSDAEEPPRLLHGPDEPKAFVVNEAGLRFEVEPLSPRTAGLYMDARPARAWLRENSAGRIVLNLFAYTGSLGMAASAGDARGVTHVEMQRRALRRLRRNYALNGLHLDGRDVIEADLYRWMRKAVKGKRRFGGIILDPPPQVPARGLHDKQGQDYETLMPLATALLGAGGWVLCFFNRRDRSLAEEEAAIHAASPVSLDVLYRGTSGIDFPEQDPDRKLRFTAFAATS